MDGTRLYRTLAEVPGGEEVLRRRGQGGEDSGAPDAAPAPGAGRPATATTTQVAYVDPNNPGHLYLPKATPAAATDTADGGATSQDTLARAGAAVTRMLLKFGFSETAEPTSLSAVSRSILEPIFAVVHRLEVERPASAPGLGTDCLRAGSYTALARAALFIERPVEATRCAAIARAKLLARHDAGGDAAEPTGDGCPFEMALRDNTPLQLAAVVAMRATISVKHLMEDPLEHERLIEAVGADVRALRGASPAGRGPGAEVGVFLPAIAALTIDHADDATCSAELAQAEAAASESGNARLRVAAAAFAAMCDIVAGRYADAARHAEGALLRCSSECERAAVLQMRARCRRAELDYARALADCEAAVACIGRDTAMAIFAPPARHAELMLLLAEVQRDLAQHASAWRSADSARILAHTAGNTAAMIEATKVLERIAVEASNNRNVQWSRDERARLQIIEQQNPPSGLVPSLAPLENQDRINHWHASAGPVEQPDISRAMHTIQQFLIARSL